MLKKWWIWLLIILFIVINLIINSRPDETEHKNEVNPIHSEISTH